MIIREAFTQHGRFWYRCSDGGFQAVADELIVSCLWHGEDCINWHLQVDPDKAKAFLEQP